MNPVIRILKISIIVAVLLAIPALLLRSLLLTNKYQAWDHPIFAGKSIIGFKLDVLNEVNLKKLSDLDRLSSQGLNFYPAVSVTINQPTSKSGGFIDMRDPAQREADKLNIAEQIKVYTDLISQHKNIVWLINIMANHPEVDQIIDDGFKELADHRLFVFLSPYDNILNSLKQKRPTWAFASGKREQTQFSLFESIYLLPLVNSPADVGILDINSTDIDSLKNICAEYLRRKKLCVYMGKFSNENITSLLSTNNSVIVDDPNQIESQLFNTN